MSEHDHTIGLVVFIYHWILLKEYAVCLNVHNTSSLEITLLKKPTENASIVL